MIFFVFVFSLRVVFINDLHGHYENLPGLVRIIKEYRTENSLLLNGADEFTGTSLFRYYGGNKSIEIINELKYDAMTLGNHEFDKGSVYLANYLKQLKIPIVSSNVVSLKEMSLNTIIKPYIIKNDIGIIGSTTPDTKFQSPTKDVDFLPFIEMIQKYVNELNSKGIKKIILLSHNGFLDDKEIAKNTTGVSVIVGAHSHSLLSNNESYADDKIEGVFPTIINNVYIVQAKCYGKYVGYFDLEFVNNVVSSFKGDTVRVDPNNVDRQWQLRLEEWNKPVDLLYNSTISYSSVEYRLDCWKKSCALNALIANAMVNYYLSRRKDWSIPTFALIQTGAVRVPFNIGNITIGNVYDALPFDDKINAVVIRGSKILSAVKDSLAGRRGDEKVTGYVVVSRHAQLVLENGLLKQMKVLHNSKWIILQPHHYYRVVSSSFVLSGGDNIFPKFSSFNDGLEYISDATIAVFKKFKDISEI